MFVLRLIGLILLCNLLWFLALISSSASETLAFVLAAVAAICTFWVYMFPTYEAQIRKHHNMSSIMLVNLLLGWTLIGWVVAAAWALSKPPMLAVTENTPDKSTADDTIDCPFCDEPIKPKAIRCKHCQADLLGEI